MKATKQIFNRIQMLNPTVSEISSMGQFVSQSNQMVADSMRDEVYNAIPKDSLAYTILNGNDKFSDKQLWVIAYELEKNAGYVAQVIAAIEELNRAEDFKKARKRAKKEGLIKTSTNKPVAPTAPAVEIPTYGINTKVAHSKFGEGAVTAEDATRITINFTEVGNKNLLKQFVTLEII